MSWLMRIPRALVAGTGALALGAALAAGALAPTRADSTEASSYLQFTALNLGGDNAPTWSSDGLYVYYSSRVTGFPYIYRKATNLPSNQSGTRLTTWEIEELSASVSGDGLFVVMAVRDAIGRTHLWRCPGSGGLPLTAMTDGATSDDLHPTWWGSNTTGDIAFATNRGGTGYQIWTLKPRGIQVANQYTPVTGPGYEDLFPSFSPDGQQIAFSSNRAGAARQIFVASRQSGSWGAPVQLTSGPGEHTNPAFSPSGLSIAYQVRSGSNTALWIMDASGANPRPITDGNGSYDAEPAWSPTTSQMAFVSDRSGAGYIWLINDVSTPAVMQSWGRIKATYRR